MVAVVVLATVATVFPGFLIGALSVQVSDEFDVSEATYGWGLGSFFLAATAGSIVMGRLAQRIGPRNQIVIALGASATAQLGLAAFAESFAAVVGFLMVAGFMNSAVQTAVNLALARAQLTRLGLAMALKQSGMPSAALLSGFAVPVLALTVGWRWAYVSGAGLALVALTAVRIVIEPLPRDALTRSAAPASSRRSLTLAALTGTFLAFSAGSLNAWVVSSGVDAGISPGVAGLMLSLGAGSGIALRLVSGLRSDSMTMAPFRAGGLTALVGAIGMAALASRVAGLHVAATILAFGGGWIWPVFTNFGVVRTNAAAAGAATGVTQMGVYVGVFTAPLVTGQLIDRSGYQLMWLVVAAAAVIGAAIALLIADDF